MDVSEGVGESDSTVEVFAGDTREQAAELADNHMTPAELGRFAAAVARFYNDALVCCVRPMHGMQKLNVAFNALIPQSPLDQRNCSGPSCVA